MLLSLAEASAACQARSLGRARLGARSGMCGTIFGHVRHGRVWLGALLRRVECLGAGYAGTGLGANEGTVGN